VTDTCFKEHFPSLIFKSSVCPSTAGCSINPDNLCQCVLDKKEVSLQVDTSVANQIPWTDKAPGSFPLPFNLKESGSFNYVTNLTERLEQTLDPQVFTDAPPGSLAARMDIPFESVTACSLALRPDEGNQNVHAMSFRPLGTAELSGQPSQAVSQQVLTTLTLPSDSTVVLNIRSFGSTTQIPATLAPETDGYKIELSNMRSEKEPVNVDDPCDDGVGRDFAFFFELTNEKLDWPKRPIPHVKLTHWKSSTDLLPEQCQNLGHHTPSSRPICPMGSFDPVVTP
jgi:hypothetical protein